MDCGLSDEVGRRQKTRFGWIRCKSQQRNDLLLGFGVLRQAQGSRLHPLGVASVHRLGMTPAEGTFSELFPVVAIIGAYTK